MHDWSEAKQALEINSFRSDDHMDDINIGCYILLYLHTHNY